MNEEKGEEKRATLETQPISKAGRPHYVFEMCKRWERWTDIEDPDVLEGLDYLSGDLFFEMRKLTSQICIANEEAEKKLIRKLDALLGLQGDREKLRAVGEIVFDVIRGEKDTLKGLVDKSWRDIVDKQKVGIDKVCIVVTRHVFEKTKQINGEKKTTIKRAKAGTSESE